jgi:AcrR family transcriptional regulator
MNEQIDERTDPSAFAPAIVLDDRARHDEWAPHRPVPVHTRPRRGRPPKDANAPHGPEQVVQAVVEVATQMFARFGYGTVSLRQVAAEAGVNPGLVHRYIGSKEDVLRAVFERFTRELEDGPHALRDLPPSAETERLLYTQHRIIAHLTLEGYDISRFKTSSPVVEILLANIHGGIEIDDHTARIRALQIMALGLGWRMFETFLLGATGLHEDDREEIEAALRAANLAIGSGV